MQRTIRILSSQASPGQLLRAYLAPQGPVRSSCQGQNLVVPRMHKQRNLRILDLVTSKDAHLGPLGR